MSQTKTRRDFLGSATGGATAVAASTLFGSPREGESIGSLQGQPTRTFPLTGSELLTQVLPLDGTDWLLGIDPKNEGREQHWYERPRADAKPTKVPWIIHDAFPEYHGVAWYWRSFAAPANPHAQGRYLLRFHLVDYLAEIWVNGTKVGSHEGGQEPFVLDATVAIKANGENRLAVRVLNPTYEPIDGIALRQVAEGRRDYPRPRDNAYHVGGIVGSVELLVAPSVRLEDLYVTPDWKTGDVKIQATVRNAGDSAVTCHLWLSVAPTATGEPAAAQGYEEQVSPGQKVVEAKLRVENHRLWDSNDPYLYRVTARVEAAGTHSVDERSARCGFRDFRFEDGYFRLNGRRICLHGPLYAIPSYPLGFILPPDNEWLLRDAFNMKAAGFNFVRIHCGPAQPRLLDIMDELGLLGYEEHYAARELADSPLLEERFDKSISGVIRRDRNHPSIVMWGLLNEVKDGRVFRHAVKALEAVRSVDETRVVMLNSGRFDHDYSIGTLSNPGSREWENVLRDVHIYPTYPHTAEIIAGMRSPGLDSLQAELTKGTTSLPILLSEHGVCGAQDYQRFVRHCELLGKEDMVDARHYRELWERFLADWKKWKLDECWACPDDYFTNSELNEAQLALNDNRAWMSNPAMVGDLTSTGITDGWFNDGGIFSYFRDLKPGMFEAFVEMAAKVRWCLFVNPVNAYRGSKVKIEAVLLNHDALKPGKYPARFQVVGPKNTRVFERTVNIEIPAHNKRPEPPFAQSVFTGEFTLDGPSGRYRFLATLEQGAPAAGGDLEFYAADRADMPAVSSEVVLWGEDAELGNWLSQQGIRARPFGVGRPMGREVILACGRPPASDTGQSFAELARRIAQGSTVVFLQPDTLIDPATADTKPPIPLRWAPFPSNAKPSVDTIFTWFFRADFWAKEHPIFEGLPCGGIMNYVFYQDVFPKTVKGGARTLVGLEPPLEAVSGALDTSSTYSSDLLITVHTLGAGRFILNTLQIREGLGKTSAADRLLRNLLNFAARDEGKPGADLPGDFDAQLRALGYL